MWTEIDYQIIESNIGYCFRNRDLLRKAFTTKGYCVVNQLKDFHNERLEFFGDALIEVICTKYLYNRFSNLSEGDLTELRSRIVCGKSLAKALNNTMCDSYILLSSGDRNNYSEKMMVHFCENTYESLCAAIYIDGGMNECEAFVKRTLLDNFSSQEDIYSWLPNFNARRVVLELFPEAMFQVVKKEGQDVTVSIEENGTVFVGTAQNKKDAFQIASSALLKCLRPDLCQKEEE